MNIEKLKDFLKENIDYTVARFFFNNDLPDSDDSLEYHEEEIAVFYRELQKNSVIVVAEDSYGGEGKGEDFWSVYSFSSGDAKVYVKFNGWYQSYNGSELDEWFLVEPKEVTVTRYFKVE